MAGLLSCKKCSGILGVPGVSGEGGVEYVFEDFLDIDVNSLLRLLFFLRDPDEALVLLPLEIGVRISSSSSAIP